MGVNLGRLGTGMTQQFLDIAQICTRFEEMSGKRMAQTVRCHRFVNASHRCRVPKDFLNTAFR